jgi:uncharacterized protein
MSFVGRNRELGVLSSLMTEVSQQKEGRLLSIRGRRQVGKSRLIEVFLQESRFAGVFFTAQKDVPVGHNINEFMRSLGSSTLTKAHALANARPTDWLAALRLLAEVIAAPTVIVVDEFPWLSEPGVEAAFQVAWDRALSAKPVLLVLVGSDLTTMERLSQYGRPLYGRAREMVVRPLDIFAAHALIGGDAALAIDATLLTGGYPKLLKQWRAGESPEHYIQRQLTDDSTDFVVLGQRVLDAECPADTSARRVLAAIGGHGETSFRNISNHCGVSAPTLSKSLTQLSQKNLVCRELPLSATISDIPRYRIDDSYLRFWLAAVEPSLPLLARGRFDLAGTQALERWQAWRGRAVEPLIRESVFRLAADHPALCKVGEVGGYWTRDNQVEVDIVCTRRVGASPVLAVGSIKWRSRGGFTVADMAHTLNHRSQVPGANAALTVGVSRNGFAKNTELDVQLGPSDLVNAWR